MKIIALLVALLATTLASAGQTTVTNPTAPQAATQSAAYPFQIVFNINTTNGAITALTATEYFRTDVTVGGVVTAQPPAPLALNLDFLGTGSKTITVLGQTFTYAQVWTALNAVLNQERTAQVAAGP